MALLNVSPSFFATTGVRLVRGRFFTDADARGAPVVVINETTARAYWPAAEALGQCLRIALATAPCATVIGVAHDAHLRFVVEEHGGEVFAPLRRVDGALVARFMVVRAAPGATAAVAGEVRRELRAEFPTAAAVTALPLATAIEPQLRPWRLGTLLFSAFGALALLVAAIGVYSVTAYAVSQRAHEMSVRVALGARRADVLRLILTRALRVTAVGAIVGTVFALAMSGALQTLLYDTPPRSASLVGAVAIAILLAAIAASAIPAWRAGAADPLEAMRSE